MAIWGKLLGGTFGFMLGGPLGALIGAVFGHNLDAGMERLALEDRSPGQGNGTARGDGFDPGLNPGETDRVQMVFFTATFSVMGHLAKADGQVTRDEITWAEGVMDHMVLTPELRKAAIQLFNEGKDDSFELEPVVMQFRRECRRRTHLLQMFLEIQIQASLADGVVDASEDSILLQLASMLGVPEAVFRQLQVLVKAGMAASSEGYSRGAGQQRSGSRQASTPSGLSVKDAYALLGVQPEADKAEVKRAYRRLMSQHHPDKLVAKGLPEEMLKLATEKTQQIQKAYETVKSVKGWK